MGAFDLFPWYIGIHEIFSIWTLKVSCIKTVDGPELFAVVDEIDELGRKKSKGALIARAMLDEHRWEEEKEVKDGGKGWQSNKSSRPTVVCLGRSTG